MKKLLTLSLHLLITTSLFSQTLPSYLPADGLVGWWPFNGNANDESGNGNNGTVNGQISFSQDRYGVISSSVMLNGIDGFIDVSNSIFNTSLSHTICIWFKTVDSTKTNQTLFNTNPHTLENLAFHYSSSTTSPPYGLSFGLGNGGVGNGSWNVMHPDNGQITTPNLNNSWHQVIWIKEEFSIWRILLDGSEIFSFSSDINVGDLLAKIRFGAENNGYSGGGVNFKGQLDDIAIYNRALTQDEITALYTGTPVNGGGGNTSANAVPPGIPYQAVVRNANGNVAANTAVTTRFTLHQTTADGTVEFQETHALTTNAQGLMATVLGQGTAVQNTFAGINWANTTKFLQVEVDLGNGYVDLGTQQLMSVPYSIQSQTALTIKNSELPIYADNAAALAGGLASGQLYRTTTGDLKIVY